jgi:hypothetical protein
MMKTEINGSPCTVMVSEGEPAAVSIAQEAARNMQTRANLRSGWLDRERERREWTSDWEIYTDGGPSYNTIAKYRAGLVTTRLAYVRRKLAMAFRYDISEVPH